MTEGLLGHEWKMLDKAILFATQKHFGQVDKSGRPYILHPLRVMQSFKHPTIKAIAVLHDVVEDCGVSIVELEGLFGEHIAMSVDILSKKKRQTLDDYLALVKMSERSRLVKIKDIEDNMSVFRLAMLPEDVALRMVKKYHYCLKFLGA